MGNLLSDWTVSWVDGESHLSNMMRLQSGKYIDLNTFTEDDITFDDILIPLSRITRFNGHGPIDPLSVIQHAMLTQSIAKFHGASAEVQLACLIHDNHEAIIGDTTSPNKILLCVEEPERITEEVRMKFGAEYIHYDDWFEVKQYDNMALNLERRVMWDDWSENDCTYWPSEEVAADKETCIAEFHYWKGHNTGEYRSIHGELIRRLNGQAQ